MQMGYDAGFDMYYLSLGPGKRVYAESAEVIEECERALDHRAARREEGRANCVAALLAASVLALGALLATYFRVV
jgi:hypothetical protein